MAKVIRPGLCRLQQQLLAVIQTLVSRHPLRSSRQMVAAVHPVGVLLGMLLMGAAFLQERMWSLQQRLQVSWEVSASGFTEGRIMKSPVAVHCRVRLVA